MCKLIVFFLGITLVLATTACGSDSNSSSDNQPNENENGPDNEINQHAKDIQPIWDTNCTEACHTIGGVWPSLRLDENAAYTSLLSGTSQQSPLVFVDPGNIESSYLWHKINGTQTGSPAFGSGAQMPLITGGSSTNTLSASEIETIRKWIVDGALP